CEGYDVGYRRVSFNNIYEARNPIAHGLKGRILHTLNASQDAPGILLRKESFRHNDEEIDIDGDCKEENNQRDGGVPQDPSQALLVDAQYPGEDFLARRIEFAVIFLALVLEKPGAHHRSGRQ